MNMLTQKLETETLLAEIRAEMRRVVQDCMRTATDLAITGQLDEISKKLDNLPGPYGGITPKYHPYEVRNNYELRNESEDGISIWLPGVDNVLEWAGKNVTLTGVSAIPDGDGWYDIEDSTDGESVWLVVTVDDATGEVDSAVIKKTEGEGGESGKTVHNIIIAQQERPSGGVLPRWKQYVTSAIIRGGEGEEFLHPFEVRWSDSVNNWIIWLPRTKYMIRYNGGSFLAISSGITAVPGMADGWYSMSEVSASNTTVYLTVMKNAANGTYTARLAYYGTTGDSDGNKYWNFYIAKMGEDDGGNKFVRQITDSFVWIDEDSGGSVSLDDISTDYNDNGEVQIKDFDTGTPAASTTVAADLVNGASNPDKFVCRNAKGQLVYKSPGNLGDAGGVTRSNQTIITAVRWDTSTHQLMISSANISIKNGIITQWAANIDVPIPTVAISGIMGGE